MDSHISCVFCPCAFCLKIKGYLDRFSYKPSWEISVSHHNFAPQISVTWIPEGDSTGTSIGPGDNLRIGGVVSVAEDCLYSEERFWAWFYHEIRSWELHEINEWFKVDGIAPHDPHAPRKPGVYVDKISR